MTPILALLIAAALPLATPDAGVGTSSLTLRISDSAVSSEGTAGPESPPAGASSVVGGWATWYRDSRKSGLYAAAGPLLRGGNWRGRNVTVCHAGKCVDVRLTDWCACGNRHGRSTVIDLSPAAFRALAPLSRGVIEVSVLSGPGLPLPPQTDTAS